MLKILLIMIIPILFISAFAEDYPTIDVKTDKLAYFYGDTITISGNVSEIIPDEKIKVKLTSSTRGPILDVPEITVNDDGTFSQPIKAFGFVIQNKEGNYFLTVSYGSDENNATTIFSFNEDYVVYVKPDNRYGQLTDYGKKKFDDEIIQMDKKMNHYQDRFKELKIKLKEARDNEQEFKIENLITKMSNTEAMIHVLDMIKQATQYFVESNK